MIERHDSLARTTSHPHACVRTEHLTRIYSESEGRAALENVSFSAREGRVTCIMGRSGSGKTTLLHLLAGLDRPTSGAVYIGDTSLYELSDRERTNLRRRQIGIVFQHLNLLPALTASDNVALPLIIDGVARDEAGDAARVALGAVGLAGIADRRPDQLSGGEQQRVAIARAMVMRPTVLLADEPTGNLDSDSAEVVLELIQAMQVEGTHSTLVVTHDTRVAARADEIVRISDGRVVDTLSLVRISADQIDVDAREARVVEWLQAHTSDSHPVAPPGL